MSAHSALREDAQSARLRVIRFLVTLACFWAALLMYLDRVCVSTVDRLIRDDLGLTDPQMDWFKGIFFLAYALGQVPSGWLADRFGARVMMTVYVTVWSLLMAAMGCAQSFWTLLLARAGYGLAQAGGYPTAASLVGRWTPVESRGAASAFVSFGGRLGGVVAPVLTSALVVLLLPVDGQPSFDRADLRDPPALRAALVAANNANSSRSTESTTSAPSVGAANSHDDWRLAIAERVWERLPTDERMLFVNEPTSIANHAANDGTLIAALNLCLTERELVPDSLVAAAPLPREAISLLRISTADRSPADTVRLNRLMIETAFPAALRSIYHTAWRPAMWLYGVAGLVVGALFWFVARDSPELHPWLSAGNSRPPIQPLTVGQSTEPTPASLSPRQRSGIPWAALARSRSLWMISLSQFGTNVGWAFVITSFPRFLNERFQTPFTDASRMQSVVLAIGIAGTLLGGTLTDLLVRRLGGYWGRMLPMSVTRLVCAASCATCLAFDSPWPITAALAAMAFFTDLGMAAIWGFSQDVGGRHVGSVLGWGNMWGNLGAFLSPLAIGASVQAFGWNAAFWICCFSFVVAGVSGLYVDARRPVFGDPAPAQGG